MPVWFFEFWEIEISSSLSVMMYNLLLCYSTKSKRSSLHGCLFKLNLSVYAVVKICMPIVTIKLNFQLQNLPARSQPDNLVMLCKFKSLSLFISLEIDSFYIVYKHRKICIAWLNCRAGFATDQEVIQPVLVHYRTHHFNVFNEI